MGVVRLYEYPVSVWIYIYLCFPKSEYKTIFVLTEKVKREEKVKIK